MLVAVLDCLMLVHVMLSYSNASKFPRMLVHLIQVYCKASWGILFGYLEMHHQQVAAIYCN